LFFNAVDSSALHNLHDLDITLNDAFRCTSLRLLQ
jgi:hypothetical protein